MNLEITQGNHAASKKKSPRASGGPRNLTIPVAKGAAVGSLGPTEPSEASLSWIPSISRHARALYDVRDSKTWGTMNFGAKEHPPGCERKRVGEAAMGVARLGWRLRVSNPRGKQPQQLGKKEVGTLAPGTARCEVGLVGLLRGRSR
ncbi:hypothetical protein CRG98_029512 [Punica granatum]|uniref:Uncharacterized protein n=1 Tax=Punica granatum TaxID=22663 RepID=A0A2I0J1F2_PUNGR|nr:hypothetical protein CRG98_029512 [Punica granatum]